MSYGYFGSMLNDELNRLANGGTYPARSAYLDEAGAAQAWAAAKGVNLGGVTDLTGVLNKIYAVSATPNNWLDLTGVCNKLGGTSQLAPAAALREVAS